VNLGISQLVISIEKGDIMKVNVKKITGVWDLGYYLDKHIIKSVPIGEDQWGHMQFDTIRSEAGEALYQLKYQSDFTQVTPIACQMHESLFKFFSSANLVIPMPPSEQRKIQPVKEISKKLSRLMNIPYNESMLVKQNNTRKMKDIASKEEKEKILINVFVINDTLSEGHYDVLIVDDIYASGSSLDAATNALRKNSKIKKIYVATVTRTK
jgi:predicted amidophosphoribosyltransferase